MKLVSAKLIVSLAWFWECTCFKKRHFEIDNYWKLQGMVAIPAGRFLVVVESTRSNQPIFVTDEKMCHGEEPGSIIRNLGKKKTIPGSFAGDDNETQDV